MTATRTRQRTRVPRRRKSAKPSLFEGLLDLDEAAAALDRDRSTLWRWASDGAKTRSGRVFLSARRFGNQLFFSPADIDRFGVECAEANRRPSPDQNEGSR